MSATPTIPISLFDLTQIGSVGIALILIFLVAGLVFFFLSFTTRHGRSRWPLHALMALGIVAVGSGVTSGAHAAVSVIGYLGSPAIPGAGDPASLAAMAIGALTGPFWLGMIGALLGMLAGFRAILGLIREPGPRF